MSTKGTVTPTKRKSPKGKSAKVQKGDRYVIPELSIQKILTFAVVYTRLQNKFGLGQPSINALLHLSVIWTREHKPITISMLASRSLQYSPTSNCIQRLRQQVDGLLSRKLVEVVNDTGHARYLAPTNLALRELDIVVQAIDS